MTKGGNNLGMGLARRAGWAAGCLMTLAAAAVLGGCAGGEMTRITDETEFQRMVIDSHKIIMVDFYKSGCPTCAALDGKMDQLVREYRGRVVIAKFMLMQPYGLLTSPKLKKRYDIFFYPTVILFVDGQERTRLIDNGNLDDYRKALDSQLGVATPRSDLGPGPTTR